MDQKELENKLNENTEKERRTVAFLGMMLKVVGVDVTATESWQQKLNEKYNFTPPEAQDAYTDLLITIENSPKELRLGLIKALIVRYFSVSELMKLRAFAGEVQVELLSAAREDKELAATASKPNDLNDLLKEAMGI